MRRFEKIKRIVASVLTVAALCLSLCACATNPPEYAEIEDRFKELVLASGEINEIFFGEGLETFPRVTDPYSTLKVKVEENVDENGETVKTYHYYYYITDETYGQVVAYRNSPIVPFVYLEVRDEPYSDREAFYESAERDVYAYEIEGYTEPEVELYYSSDDPENYDYVRYDEKYDSVAEIKKAAEKIYSKSYLDSIYTTMFLGGTGDGDANEFTARYIEYADEDGNVSLMKSNEYKPLITETRVFDFDTAQMIKPSNGEFVTISIESYLPSAPQNRLTVKLTMILEDGVWMLDSATY